MELEKWQTVGDGRAFPIIVYDFSLTMTKELVSKVILQAKSNLKGHE